MRMKKILMAFIVMVSLLTASGAFAGTTFYVAKNGGTASQCNGLSNKSYTPIISDVTHDCAFNHPFWAIAPQGNTPSPFKGGDTLIIDNIDSATSKQADYQMGLGAPNNNCNQGYPWDCVMRSIPSGPDSLNPSRILGKTFDTGCATAPKLWGTERAWQVLSLNGSNNVELQCLDITDNSECIESGPNVCKRDGSYPFGAWAGYGIKASDSTNVLLKNVRIHGMAHGGIQAGRLKDWTIEDSSIIANPWVGWDGDIGAGVSSNSGFIKFIRTKIKYSGCGEKLDGTPYNCFSQSQGGYGDAIGTQSTGGDWIFDGVDISNNVSDGIDLLYHNGNGKIVIKNSTIGGNAGNQVKNATSSTIDNSTITGNCNFFKNNPIALQLHNGQGFDSCRAGGDVIAFAMKPGGKNAVTNTAIKNILNIGIITIGANCNGTESVTVDSNTTFELKPKFMDPSSLANKYYAAGATGNGDGSCGSLKLTTVASTTPCVTNGSCTASVPSCGQTTTGVDNCGTTCTKTGSACACVPDNTICSASVPACGQTTTGTNNCGQPCTKQGAACTSCTFQWCGAAKPTVAGQKTEGKDNCGNYCSKFGVAIDCPACPICPTCPVCPAPVVCTAPVVDSVTIKVTSNGVTYTQTK